MRRESSARRKALKRASWIPVGRDATRIRCPCGARTCFACKAPSDWQSEASQWPSVVIRDLVVRVPLSSAAISGHQWSSEYLCKVALNAVEGLGGCLIQPVDQDACMPAEERLTKHAVSSEVISGHRWSSVVISGHQWSSRAHLTKHAVGLRHVRILELNEGFNPIATGGKGVRVALKVALQLLHAHVDRDECRLPCPCRLHLGHQWQSEVIRGNQRSSVAIRGHQWQLEVISARAACTAYARAVGSSAAIRGHQWPSKGMRSCTKCASTWATTVLLPVAGPPSSNTLGGS